MSSEMAVCLRKLEDHVLKMREQMDYQSKLMISLCEDRGTGASDKSDASTNGRSLYEERLRQAICETIEVLEESRKAFKSKKLETLRKKLTTVLIHTT